MSLRMYVLLVSACISLVQCRHMHGKGRYHDNISNLINRYKDETSYSYDDGRYLGIDKQELKKNDKYEDIIDNLSNYIENVKDEVRHGVSKSHVPIHDDIEEEEEEEEEYSHSRDNVEETDVNKNNVEGSKIETKTLKMPNVSPKFMDTYLCHAMKLPDVDRYIVNFTPLAKQQIAHHMLLFGCNEPFKDDGKAWNCREMQPVCKSGPQSIMYAWANGAPSLKLPKNVGFHTGGNSPVRYLVLQVHYLHVDGFKNGKTDSSGLRFAMTNQKLEYLAGIYLLADGMTPIPPHKEKSHIDMGCHYPIDAPTIYPFRFRTHAHKLGVVITGYRVRNGVWTIIGRGDPQRPQAFYHVFSDIDIQPDDYVMGRCTYNSMSRNTTTYIGATHKDEMCNFYIMFFYKSRPGEDAKFGCGYVNHKAHAPYNNYPKDSDTALAVMEAKNKHLSDEERFPTYKALYKQIERWPVDGYRSGDLPLTVGQISGVDFDNKADMVVVFHRGHRVWGMDTFDRSNRLRKKYHSTVQSNTLIWLKRSNGEIVKVGGARMFCVPHGITVDHEGNIWVTDVGTHQVFKLSPELVVLLSLGVRFEPGNDDTHFCKPTDVAVMKNGDFFVSDGYCNSRVLKFNKDGKLLLKIYAQSFAHNKDFPKPHYMNVVHGLSLDENNNCLFVADRENKRVLLFNPNTGDFIKAIVNKFGGAVYAIAYNEAKGGGGVLHVVNGPTRMKPVTVSGFTYDLSTDTVASEWRPNKGFNLPHDLAVTKDNNNIFVAEIGPNKVWKFDMNRISRP